MSVAERIYPRASFISGQVQALKAEIAPLPEKTVKRTSTFVSSFHRLRNQLFPPVPCEVPVRPEFLEPYPQPLNELAENTHITITEKLLSHAQEIHLGWQIKDAQEAEAMMSEETAPHSPKKNARLQEIRQEGMSARSTLAEHNLGLVFSIARKYQSRQVSRADLIGEGTVGLMEAIDVFNPSLGYRFTTNAYWMIRRRVRNAAKEQRKTIVVPADMHDKYNRFLIAESIADQQAKRILRDDELSEQLGISEQRIATMRASAVTIISADTPFSEDSGSETLFDITPDNSHQNNVPTLVEQKETAEAVRKLIDPKEGLVTEEESLILKLSFGIDCIRLDNPEIAQLLKMRVADLRSKKKTTLQKLSRSSQANKAVK